MENANLYRSDQSKSPATLRVLDLLYVLTASYCEKETRAVGTEINQESTVLEMETIGTL